MIADPRAALAALPKKLQEQYELAVEKAVSVGALKMLTKAEAAIGRWYMVSAGARPPRAGPWLNVDDHTIRALADELSEYEGREGPGVPTGKARSLLEGLLRRLAAGGVPGERA